MEFLKGCDRPKKVQLVLSFIIRVTIFIAIVGAIINRNWTVLFVSLLTFLLLFLPSIIAKNFKIHLPGEFEIIIVLFIYASLFLGEAYGFYTSFWWWDLVLHTGSGLALGLFGFLTLYVLYDEKKLKAKPITIAFFSFAFALALGALWEILEFVIDQVFTNAQMQKSLTDTMWDLIVDAGGALVTSAVGFIYVNGGKTHLFGMLIGRFLEHNPGFIKKRHRK